mgnify:CR=1 FL=1
MSQFTDEGHRKTLGDYISIPQVYPAGRLDYESEGLMLLTDNGSLQQQISHPKFKLRKTYWVHVEGISTYKHCEALRAGIDLKDGFARALSCRVLAEPALWKRNPPIRSRKTVADTWLEIVIDEGRNRQIRRMTAAVGLPTLRLVRRAIGSWTLGDLKPGEYRYDQTHKKSFNNAG